MNTETHLARTRRKWTFLSIGFILFAITAGLFTPWNISALSSHAAPVQSYEEAVKRIDALKAERASEMNPKCVTQFMTHGKKVERAVVLAHGYTNCPNEFVGLGKQLYGMGYNVLIAPLPHQGLANRLNDEQGQLTAEELAAYADKVVDIAQGLGDKVTILGYSCGGVVTAWAAQNRSDVDTAMVISPAFGYLEIPTQLTAPAMNAVLALPDEFVWWDPKLQAADGFDYTYPRYSKHALAQILRLGFSVQVNARKTSPLAKRIFVVTNANDDSVNNELTAKVAQTWIQHDAQVITYEFTRTLKLPHNLIDPNESGGNTEAVNQKLIELLTNNIDF